MVSFVALLVICICCRCCCITVEGFLLHPGISINHALSKSKLDAFHWPTLSSSTRTVGERNGLNEDYPWRFEGRFIFRPSLVRITPTSSSPPAANLLSVLGYSLGGSVVLEYDISPVGPYREYVTMGGVVGLGQVTVGETNKGRLLGIGQWGTDLYVSTQIAEDVCKQVWGVPAQVADIELNEIGGTIQDGRDDDDGGGEANVGQRGEAKRKFTLHGWENTRVLSSEELIQQQKNRIGSIPIFWTPTIKALWAPISFPNIINNEKMHEDLLPVHTLRLSASALRFKQCKRIGKSEGEIPLGIALVVDNVLIEIGERVNSGSL